MRAISVCSRSTISFGVPAGTSTPCMVSASWPLIPSSSSVGTSGSAGERFLAVIASARSLPSLTSGVAGGIAWKHIGVCPATTDWIDGSAAGERREREIEPEGQLEQLDREIRRRADAGRSEGVLCGIGLEQVDQLLHRFAGMLGLTNSALGEPAALVTGAKSLSGS